MRQKKKKSFDDYGKKTKRPSLTLGYFDSNN